MHLAAGWSFRHRRSVLIGWPPPYSPAEAGQVNASRTVAFASGVLVLVSTPKTGTVS